MQLVHRHPQHTATEMGPAEQSMEEDVALIAVNDTIEEKDAKKTKSNKSLKRSKSKRLERSSSKLIERSSSSKRLERSSSLSMKQPKRRISSSSLKQPERTSSSSSSSKPKQSFERSTSTLSSSSSSKQKRFLERSASKRLDRRASLPSLRKSSSSSKKQRSSRELLRSDSHTLLEQVPDIDNDDQTPSLINNSNNHHKTRRSSKKKHNNHNRRDQLERRASMPVMKQVDKKSRGLVKKQLSSRKLLRSQSFMWQRSQPNSVTSSLFAPRPCLSEAAAAIRLQRIIRGWQTRQRYRAEWLQMKLDHSEKWTQRALQRVQHELEQEKRAFLQQEEYALQMAVEQTNNNNHKLKDETEVSKLLQQGQEIMAHLRHENKRLREKNQTIGRACAELRQQNERLEGLQAQTQTNLNALQQHFDSMQVTHDHLTGVVLPQYEQELTQLQYEMNELTLKAAMEQRHREGYIQTLRKVAQTLDKRCNAEQEPFAAQVSLQITVICSNMCVEISDSDNNDDGDTQSISSYGSADDASVSAYELDNGWESDDDNDDNHDNNHDVQD